MNWKKKNRFWKGIIIPGIIFICLLTFLYYSVENVSGTSDKENIKMLESAVKRAMVQCYAIEGMYPPNVDYLEKNYGVVVDHEKYMVHYEVFASNILPDVQVIDLNVQ